MMRFRRIKYIERTPERVRRTVEYLTDDILKYSDGSIDMSTKLIFDNLKCNNGSSAPYYSGDSKVTFPFSLKEIYDVQMHLSSSTIGWISDVSNKAALDSVTFRVATVYKEEDLVYKQVFVNVKGVLA